MRYRTLALALLAWTPLPASAETVTIEQIGFYFSPREVVIQPGDTVKWVRNDGSHTVSEGTDGIVNGNELFTSPLTSGTTMFSFTFTPTFLAQHPKPNGRYDFFCAPHFSIGMTGGVTVADPAPGTSFCLGDGSGSTCPCANASTAPTGCLNSVLKGARLRAAGTASVAADTFTLSVSGPPEGGNVLFFQGTTQVNGGAGTAFGDGLRCAGGSIVRLSIQTISFGYARYPSAGDLPVSAKASVPSGATRTYQVFYRDPPAACTGAHFNTSNGLAATWLP